MEGKHDALMKEPRKINLLYLLPLPFIFALLVLLPPEPPAWPYLQGLITDESGTVLAVNLYGPAYDAGLRPGDRFENLSRSRLDRPSPYRQLALLDRGSEKYWLMLNPRQMANSSEQTTFLLAPTALSFSQAEKQLAEDALLQRLAPVVKSSPGYNIIHSETELSLYDYNYRPFLLGWAPYKVRIVTDFFFTPADHNPYTIFHIESLLYGLDQNGDWQRLPASGLLPTVLLQHLLRPAAP